jgi:hypothetical protein
MSEHRKSFRIKISHDSFGECLGQTRNLSATGVYVSIRPVGVAQRRGGLRTGAGFAHGRRGCAWKW